MYGKRGMKAAPGSLSSSHDSPVTVSTRGITVEDLHGHLWRDSILRIILDFEDGTRPDEIVDVNITEKRKLGHAPQRCSVKRRIDTEQSETLSPPTPACRGSS